MNTDRMQFLTVPVTDQAEARDFDLDSRMYLQVSTRGVGLLEPSVYGNWPR